MCTHLARANIRCHAGSCPTSLLEVKQWYLPIVSFVSFRRTYCGRILSPINPIIIGEDGSTISIALQMFTGAFMLMPVLPTLRGFLDFHAPPNAASATTSFAPGIRSVCSANIIGAILWSIPGFVYRGRRGMVQWLSNLCSKLPWLV